MVAQTRHAGQPSPKRKLEFRDKLVGKGLSTDALLKKMKSLHTQLAALDQDHVDVQSLGTARKELINTSILLHKDRGVKAYAACCLADILRLYAPDAPYTEAELRDIFQFFVRQLSNGLKGSDATYYNEYFHLLESLSTVKSVVLVCDLPSADELMIEIFREFFALVRRDISKKVELFMSDILVALIDEAQSLPSDVMDTILAQFTDKNARLDQPAYRLAVQICNTTADKLQRNVVLYFSDIIASHTEEDEYDDIRNAHDLIKALHRSCPGVLHSVIPLLEEELRADDLTVRTMATQVLGEMYADKAGGDLMRKYPSTWSHWLMRKSDKAVTIRLKLVESCRSLIINCPDARESIATVLSEKVLDPDEKVRAAVCRVYSQLDYESALHHVSKQQLLDIAERGMDKKPAVRVEALNSIGKLYSLAYPEIENNDEFAITRFGWIPDEVLKISGTSPEIRAVVEQVLAEHILPFPSTSGPKGPEVDNVAWTDRLLCILRYASEKSIKGLLGITGLKSIRPNVYQIYIEACIRYNGGIVDKDEELVTRRLNAAAQNLAVNFPDPHKANEDLHAFAKLNESRLFKLAKICMDPQTDLKGLIKATNEFQRRLDQSSSTLIPTLTIFIRRASFRFINQASIPSLLKRVSKSYGSTAGHLIQAAAHAQTLLQFMSKFCPDLYKSHVAELVKALADEKNTQLAELALQALSGLVKSDESVAPTEKRTNERIERFALHHNWRLAKFATRYLAFSRDKQGACTRLADTISEELSAAETADFDGVSARVAALAQLAKFSPDVFESQSGVIMAFLVKKLLMVPSPVEPDAMDDGEEWVENDEVPELLRAKLQALKACRSRCLTHASSPKATEIATPVLKMYATILEHNGSLNPTHEEDPTFLSRIRLQAAVSLLLLFTVDLFATAMMPKFLRLAIVIQDSCYNVRFGFLTKVVSLLQPRKLPPQFNIVPFLTIHDPENDVKNLASSYIQSAKKRLPHTLRINHLQFIFIRFLHLLAHHPDFSTSHDDLLDIAKYVQFYLDLIADHESVSLLHHLTLKAKTVRDAESHSENFYIVAELAQELIKKKAHDRSWSIQTYPGTVKLPPDILRPLPSSEAGKEILKTAYLPEETRTWLDELSKTALPKEKRKATGKRKAPTAKPEGQKKRRRKRAKSDEDADDESAGEASSDIENDSEMEVEKPPSSPRAQQEEDTPRNRGTRVSARNLAKTKPNAKKRSTPSSEADDSSSSIHL